MTIHLHYQHKCLTCGEEYLPFNEENRNCPKCGMPAREIALLIPDVLRAATYDVRQGVFGILSLGDWYVKKAMHVIWTIAKEGLKVPKDDAGLDHLCDELLKFFDFGDCQYRIPHMKAFIRAVITEAYLKRKR